MNHIHNIWSNVSKYVLPGALVVFMIYGAASSRLSGQSHGAEMKREIPDCGIAAGSLPPDPYQLELKDIFFDPNSHEIREDAKPVLDENAGVIKSEPEALVVIESYCDTNENLTTALGKKRNDSVKSYLVGKGVGPGRIITVNKCNSYDMELINGKDSPGIGGRVHFVALDEIYEDLAFVSNQ